MPPDPLPFAPLEDLLKQREVIGVEAYDFMLCRDHHDMPVAERVQAAIGVTYRTWMRWKAADQIPFYSADRAAISLGLHRNLIWSHT